MSLQTPYLLFLGDAPDMLAAKVALGVKQWRPENCVGQLRMDGCQADCGLTDMTVAQAAAGGARTLVVGVANRGGVIAPAWVTVLKAALEAGMDLAAGCTTASPTCPSLPRQPRAWAARCTTCGFPRTTIPSATA